MGDSDTIDEGEEPVLDGTTGKLPEQHARGDEDGRAPGKRRDEAATASDKLRNESDPDNASSETS